MHVKYFFFHLAWPQHISLWTFTSRDDEKASEQSYRVKIMPYIICAYEIRTLVIQKGNIQETKLKFWPAVILDPDSGVDSWERKW